MILDKGDWPDQQIIASSQKVHIKQDMVPHQTVNSLIISNSVSRPKLDDDFLCRLFGNYAFGFVKAKNISRIGEKFKLSLHFRGISQC